VLVGRLTHLTKAASTERAAQLLDQFHLTDAANRPVRTYSGGMRRRLDLGAALVTHPPVLFLDEPTTGLDPASRLDLWGVIEELVHDGTTVLLTTQYLEEADRLADNIVVIDGGLVVAEGTAKTLKSRLGDTVIEFEFHLADTAARAATLLNGTVAAGTIVRLVLSDGPGTLRDALNKMAAADLTPAHVTLREPTLDDVFLTLTGSTGSNA
jgi:ABC-2 type transport system ATP-binding protein